MTWAGATEGRSQKHCRRGNRMRFRNKESHPPQAAEDRGQARALAEPRGSHSALGYFFTLRAELHQPCAVEAVDAVIFAEMAGQGPQISLRGDPFGVRADLVGPNLAPLDR